MATIPVTDVNNIVGKIVTFNLYATGVLPITYREVKVLGVVNADAAVGYADVVAQHAQIYSRLPTGTENNYAAYSYMLIRNANRDIIPIGVPWVLGDIEVLESSQTSVVFPNLSANQVRDLQYVLRSNGYTDFSINTKYLG